MIYGAGLRNVQQMRLEMCISILLAQISSPKLFRLLK